MRTRFSVPALAGLLGVTAIAALSAGCSAPQAPFDLSRSAQWNELQVPFDLVLTPRESAYVSESEDDLISDPLPPSVMEDGFRSTFYYLIFEKDYSASGPMTEVLDMQGRVLAKVTQRFRKDLLMEGSGKLNDGRVLNYAGRVDGVHRFHVTRHPWGRGAGNCPLKPFKSLAVDRTQIPLGSVVYIDETRGMTLPDGSKHNGVWYAEDTGGAILHDRVDLFIGEQKDHRYLLRGGITHLKALTVRILRQPDGESCAFRSPQLATGL